MFNSPDETIPNEVHLCHSPRDNDCTDNSDRGNPTRTKPCQNRQKTAGNVAKRTRSRAKQSRLSRTTMSLQIMAREYVWLWDHRHGISTKAIAMREGVTVRRVEFGLARAQAQEKTCASSTAIRPPRLVPFFPIGSYTPHSACGHNRPIAPGSVLCCMVCHRSGVDDHPALERNPLTEPAPEPKPAPAPKKTSRETRKQRRQRVFSAQP
jgi:hypothetical protein